MRKTGLVAGSAALAIMVGLSAPAAAMTAAGTAASGADGGGANAGADAGADGGGADAGAALPSVVAYVRAGDIYVSQGTGEKRLTTGGGHARPRWSPDGGQLAYLKDGRLWTMRADGSGNRRLTTRTAAGPSWSPDGKSLAFASLSCTGGPGVYRIAAGGKAAAQPEVLFPRDCRGEELPEEQAPVGRGAKATLNERLATDDAVAWSPDGKRLAFRGGDCESVYDACLTVGTLADGAEKTVAAYGGGSLHNRGFAVVPSWRADGRKLSWTAFQEGETKAESKPVHLVEYDVASGKQRIVGSAMDRELAYVDTNRAVITGQNGGGSWVTVLSLTNGARTLFRSGSQPSVQPVRR
ncbi:MAG TPA: hypothetical protein VN408_32440 [Actinoplanes sp.]|nr:hypothetical protein [Actinoplanes sp.]